MYSHDTLFSHSNGFHQSPVTHLESFNPSSPRQSPRNSTTTPRKRAAPAADRPTAAPSAAKRSRHTPKASSGGSSSGSLIDPGDVQMGASSNSAPTSAVTSATAASVSTTNTSPPSAAPAPPGPKARRVRTGCLTCRARHLKCDETPGTCLNCTKSNRLCEWGLRLNYLDIEVKKPPVCVTSHDWHIDFVDESRAIASEYANGAARYDAVRHVVLPPTTTTSIDPDMTFEYTSTIPTAPAMSHQALPSIQGVVPHAPAHTPSHHEPQQAQQHMSHQHQHHQDVPLNVEYDQSRDQYSSRGFPSAGSTYSNSSMTAQSSHANMYSTAEAVTDPGLEQKTMLTTQEETLYMQVYVEEVGIWMDSMDSMKHFSRLLPFHAFKWPMLMNAFLACGVRHLTLVNPHVYKEEKARHYYDVAGKLLLGALQNPGRDSVICATTAVILNVYEIMTEKAAPRMSHIAGARALIKECGWNARSTGIGAACFWMNVGLEVLSNLHFNWQTSWHPDDWGLDMDLSKPETQYSMEETWTHRMLYIIAKVGNFRATAPRASQKQQQALSPQDEQTKQQRRWQEWNQLKAMADMWDKHIPRTMQPMAYLYPYQTSSKSTFPEIWLIKRSTIIARLFYHTAMCLLAQINPLQPKPDADMHSMEQHHAHQICGIVAHVKDRGVASVALRSLAIAAECLTVRREQDEVLQIFTRIHKETGWRIGFIPNDLRDKWGRDPAEGLQLPTHANPAGGSTGTGTGTNTSDLAGAMTGSGNTMGLLTTQQIHLQFDQYAAFQQQQQQQQQQEAQRQQQMLQQQMQQQKAQAAQRQRGAGMVNPMFASADFSNPQHPYQEHYVAPAQSHHPDGGLNLGLDAMYASNGFQHT